MEILVFQLKYVVVVPMSRKVEKEIEVIVGWMPILLNHD